MEENITETTVKKKEENQQTDKKGYCIASMVLGIVSIVLCWVWIISVPCAILAIIFGILGIKSIGKGMAIAGLITSGIGLFISFVIFMTLIIFGFIIGISESIEYDDRMTGPGYWNTYREYDFY